MAETKWLVATPLKEEMPLNRTEWKILRSQIRNGRTDYKALNTQLILGKQIGWLKKYYINEMLSAKFKSH